MPALLPALEKEMVLRKDEIRSPRTLYIGGGTPSLYPAKDLLKLVALARRLWGVDFEECTVELNPEDVTEAYCCALREGGVNRLSLGIQSFSDEDLRWMHRRHDAARGMAAVRAAQKAGISNVSIDLIFGFPGLSLARWKAHIEQALALEPTHLSAYQLGIEPGTPLYRRYIRGCLQPLAQEAAAAQYAYLQERMAAAGWEQYEISNFARPGYRALHNSAYWKGSPYLGLGPSAHSFDGWCRKANVKSVEGYMKALAEGRLALRRERADAQSRYNEFLLTRLRRDEGFSASELLAWMTVPERGMEGAEWLACWERLSQESLRKGLLRCQGEHIKIPPDKWFVSDGIIMALMI
jgi:putative oxygen-independent coproporphyrinogen III oxidase